MFTFKRSELRKQRGMMLCEGCFDSVLEIQPINIKWGSPRSNATSLTAVNNPTVFTIGTAGVTFLGQSHPTTRDGRHLGYTMHVTGVAGSTGGAVLSDPQIVAGNDGDVVTFYGTSDALPLVFQQGNGTDLAYPVKILNGQSITFAYDASTTTWKETSRYLVENTRLVFGPMLYNDDYEYNYDAPYIGV
jgi:hypothetical protein